MFSKKKSLGLIRLSLVSNPAHVCGRLYWKGSSSSLERATCRACLVYRIFKGILKESESYSLKHCSSVWNGGFVSCVPEERLPQTLVSKEKRIHSDLWFLFPLSCAVLLTAFFLYYGFLRSKHPF